MLIVVVGGRARHRRGCIHVKGLHDVAKAAAEGLNVVLFFFSPFSATILEPDLVLKVENKN